MAVLYELAVLGSPTDEQVRELEVLVARAVLPFGLRLNEEVGWVVLPAAFNPLQQNAAGAVFFGGVGAPEANLQSLMEKGTPVLPVVSTLARVRDEIPGVLQRLNCLEYSAGGPQRVATALLECAGLLPRQRRVFLSYRRDEARQAALQLFDAFSARQFDVFLDTHGVAPGDDFQETLWHRLCDADVLVMLDTQNYFTSRWTSAEFGRALAKGISVLRVGWPDATPSTRTATASRAELLADEVDPRTGLLADPAVARISLQLEAVRSRSHAVRMLNLVSTLRNGIEQVGGSVLGVGLHKAVYLRLADGTAVVAYPAVGVPTSTALHEATLNAPHDSVAVVYDSVGLRPSWVAHLEWLGRHIPAPRWVKVHEVAWDFADWKA